MNPRWLLSHTRGYLELGLLEEAAAELAQLPADLFDGDEALALRAIIQQEHRDWPALCLTAGLLVQRHPAHAGSWITLAYATRRAVSLAAAEAILLDAEKLHPGEATIQFNLGCYACQRGDLPAARRRVDAAIALDPHFRAAADTDPDLAALRPGGPPGSDCPSAG